MQVVIFSLENEKVALETKCVHSVEKMVDFTKVTLLPTHVMGLINYNGTILTGIDLKAYLNIRRRSREESVIITEIDHEKIGIVVDSVQEVLEVEKINLEELNTFNEKIKGLIRVGDYTVTLINEKLLLRSDKLSVTWLSSVAQ
jgi:purine-binding chemotaxis protein CheW